MTVFSVKFVEVGTMAPMCRQKPRLSLRFSGHSALTQSNRFPCCLLFVRLLLTSIRNKAKSGGSLFLLMYVTQRLFIQQRKIWQQEALIENH